ncbi:universal stress protein [Mucilaginibacter sp.]|jgi:nucleotide-binding universal stress UspA family protein|uniref:universal stress protein n=1 Tax=Mucilaginibacter sp. TaxID=1882438 RepID=UPI003564F823
MKAILVLTDFSEAAHNAALYAACLTHQLETDQLILYHSYEFKAPAEVPLPGPSEMETLHQTSADSLTELKNRLRTFINERTLIDTLNDERPLLMAVTDITTRYQVELIVMGITGKNGLERVLIGSNTMIMAKESIIPVLLVPPEARYDKIRRVAFACDLKSVSASTPAREIRSLVHTLDAKLLVLNVDTEDRANFAPDTINEQMVLHQLWDKEDPEYHYAVHEDIAVGILEFTVEHDIQLVIAVPRQHTFFDRLFHGSLTKKLAFYTLIPLLLMREKRV